MYGLLGYDNIWLRYSYLNIWNLRVQKNLNIEKITIKVVEIKFLEMHITNQKGSFLYIYGRKCTKYLPGAWSSLNIRMIFGIKEKSIILTHTMFFWLLLATNIPQRLKTGFVVLSRVTHTHTHIYIYINH